MTRKPHGRRDPFEHEIEAALNPGSFISDRACFSFVRDLRALVATIATLVGTEPSRAVEVYETFLPGCYEKAEEIDDSSGSFGLGALRKGARPRSRPAHRVRRLGARRAHCQRLPHPQALHEGLDQRRKRFKSGTVTTMRLLSAIVFVLVGVSGAAAQEVILTGNTYRMNGPLYEGLPGVEIVVTRGNSVIRQLDVSA